MLTSYYTIVLASGIARGPFPTSKGAHLWARENLSGQAYSLQFTSSAERQAS